MSRKKIVIIASVVVLLGGIAAAYFFVPAVHDWVGGVFGWNKTETKPDEDKTQLGPKPVATLSTQKQTEVGKAIFSGDKESVSTIYDEAISAAPNKTDKITLSLRKSEALSQMSDIDAALAAAKEAEKIDPTDMGVLTTISTLYNQKGDKANAALYLRKVADVAPEETDSGQGTKASYIEQAEALEKS